MIAEKYPLQQLSNTPMNQTGIIQEENLTNKTTGHIIALTE